MNLDESTLAAIEASDTDELLRIIDGVCAARAWDRLDRIRSHCQAAVERGKQLWAVDEHARYRLALEAPGHRAAAAVAEGPGRFTLGPLPEVAASRHTWDELAVDALAEPHRAMTAHERVIRGEDLSDADFARQVLELPPVLQSWEPRYQVAEYKGDEAQFPTPRVPRFEQVSAGDTAPADGGPEGQALASLVAHWVETSNGRVQTAAVEGSAADAVAALGVLRPALARISPAETLAWMAWAAASGGAHGRRRGAATGRFEAWWAATVVTGMEWPPDPAELGTALGELRWHLWTDGSTEGWHLRLAVEDAEDGLAWAVAAVDERIE